MKCTFSDMLQPNFWQFYKSLITRSSQFSALLFPKNHFTTNSHLKLSQAAFSSPSITVSVCRCGSNISWLNNLFQYIRRRLNKKFINATLNTFKQILISLILNQSLQDHNIIIDCHTFMQNLEVNHSLYVIVDTITYVNVI